MRLPLVLERIAQVVVCLGIVGLPLQSPAVAGGRLVQLALVLKDNPQVVMWTGENPISVS